ncbi:MAG: DUF86 domain-containing protein [Defluviitaleaceae bacterium]|nr:DUF86 domain-containing protein [Defluviitaleaceae bacterium]
MKNKDKVCLQKIAVYCQNILSFCDGISHEDFLNSDLLKYSCSFALGQIGDLVKRISDETKEKYPKVIWHKISGLRNRVVHEYERINLDIVWETVT